MSRTTSLASVISAGFNSRRFVPGPHSIKQEPAICGARSLYKALMDTPVAARP